MPGSRARGGAQSAAPEACCRPSARGSAERRESGARRKRVPWCACASAARCSSICSPSCARRARGRRHKYEPCPSACAALQARGRRAKLRLSSAGVHQVQPACSSARTNAPRMQPKQGLRAATARAPRAHSPGATAWRAAGARLRAGDDEVAHHRVRLRPLHLVLARHAAQARPCRRVVPGLGLQPSPGQQNGL